MNGLNSCRKLISEIGNILALILCITIASGGATSARADDASDIALKKGADPVWYSEEKRALVPAIPISRNQIDAEDRFNKIATAKNTSTQGYSWTTDFMQGLLEFLRDTWQIVLLIVLVAGITLIVFVLVKIQKLVDAPGRAARSDVSLVTQQHKITDLPFELDSPDIPLLQLVEQYRNRGDYSKAIIYLYSLILIELDAVGLIRLAKGKTNWAYLSELSPKPDEKAFATNVVYWFEHVFFGKHRMDANAFEAIWTSLPNFDARLKAIHRERK